MYSFIVSLQFLSIVSYYLLKWALMIFEENILVSVLINQFVPPTFRLCFVFTGINFRGMLHHVCDVAYDENMCGPIKTRKFRSAN